jgi:hypothetical protein
MVLLSGRVFDFEILGRHHFVHPFLYVSKLSGSTKSFHLVPRHELSRLTTLSESLLPVSELISAVAVFTNGSRGRVNTADTVLFSVTMLATITPCAERLELKVLGG